VDRLDGNMLMSAAVAQRLGLYKMGERFYAPAQIRAFLPFNGAAGLETLLVKGMVHISNQLCRDEFR
ncbi:unnamed protein product, partial [Symbiodinium pilosum]